jgi:Cu(I)/Ag(I) efflux system membrane protein CusA/SilA
MCLLPSIVLWIFNRATIARRSFLDSSAATAYRSVLRSAIRYRYAFTIAGLFVLVPAAFLLRNFPRDFLPDVDEGSILYMPTTLSSEP